jgi:hypothetical protein
MSALQAMCVFGLPDARPIKIADISSWDRDDNVGYHSEPKERSEHYRYLRNRVVMDIQGYWHTVCPACRRPDLSHRTKSWYRSDAESWQRQREAEHRVCASCEGEAAKVQVSVQMLGSAKSVRVDLDGPGDALVIVRRALRNAGYSVS